MLQPDSNPTLFVISTILDVTLTRSYSASSYTSPFPFLFFLSKSIHPPLLDICNSPTLTPLPLSLSFLCFLLSPLHHVASECLSGCTPQITGLPLQTRYLFPSSNATEVVLSDDHSYECGRRGKCDYTKGNGLL